MQWSELQAAQAVWAAERFGDEQSATKALEPLAGVVEEIGELFAAKHDTVAVCDAIGDTVIFLCDVCTRMKWKMPTPTVCKWAAFHKPLGRLAHAVLKTAQDIRREEDHNANGLQAVADLLGCLDAAARMHGLGSALACAAATWKHIVSKRDRSHAAIPSAAEQHRPLPGQMTLPGCDE